MKYVDIIEATYDGHKPCLQYKIVDEDYWEDIRDREDVFSLEEEDEAITYLLNMED